MKLGLAVTMLDEDHNVAQTLQKVGEEFTAIAVAQSGGEESELTEILSKHQCATHICLPDLDTRSEEDQAGDGERFDIGARAQSRNYSAAFEWLVDNCGDLDFAVGIHGDTAIIHTHGIHWVVEKMNASKAGIGVSRAMGQSLHSAELTREQMADPDHPKGGRMQDESNMDFMPQFFVATGNTHPFLAQIKVTNPWCMEQCIGDAIKGHVGQFVFAQNAYDFSDGIFYHTPSPKGWKH